MMLFVTNQKIEWYIILKTFLKLHIRGKNDFAHKNYVSGINHMKDPRYNKGLAFTIKERQVLGLTGLLAGSVKTQQEQLDMCTFFCNRYLNPLNKYVYLAELQETNERLFFSLLNTDIEKYMPIVYTPTVGLACQRYGLIYRKPRGLFVTINDKGHILDVIQNWPVNDVKAICVTDAERVLGLGDLGAYGMGIPVGKLSLYTALAGINPRWLLPITLDVGTNNETLLQDPLYIGLRQKRTTGKEYEEFVDEFMSACVKRFGPQVLLQFEDFAYQNAAPLLAKYRGSYTTFNDDIQGTASVIVAGLMAATRITKKKMSENIYMFLGAGSAATGIAGLTVLAMIEEGLSEQEAFGKIYMCDVKGLVSTQREGGVPELAKPYGKDVPPEESFEKALATIEPNVLIGCSTVGGAFSPAILKIMAQNAERPIIFALSNPTSSAECTAQQAYDNTEGRCIFSSGSPFPPVNYKGKTFFTGQGNNSFIFPGLALAVTLVAPTEIPDTMFLTAARTLADLVTEDDFNVGRIYPSLKNIKKVSILIAERIIEMAYVKKYATRYPKPNDISKFIKENEYDLEYPCYMPTFYDVPPPPAVKLKSIAEAYPSEVPKCKIDSTYSNVPKPL